MIDLRKVDSVICACGCGGVIDATTRRKQAPVHLVREKFYLHGHNGRRPRPELHKARICICGCKGVIVSRTTKINGKRKVNANYIRGHYHISEERKKNIGRVHRERVHRKWTEAEKVAWSAFMRSIAKYGPENPSWRGGTTLEKKKIRHSREYRDWRKAVFTRDNWTCRSCRKRGGRLHPHHIKPVSVRLDLIFVVSNGLTLCIKCHRDLHRNFRPWEEKWTRARKHPKRVKRGAS